LILTLRTIKKEANERRKMLSTKIKEKWKTKRIFGCVFCLRKIKVFGRKIESRSFFLSLEDFVSS
jgi:hypothetical protein